MDPDELLLARSATDPASFEALVGRHSPALYAYLARRVPDAAEDVLSEVWLSAYVGPALFAAVHALPNAERELLLLVALDGLIPSEAGVALGIPAGTARSRLHRARLRLREQLEPAEPEPASAKPTPLTCRLIPGAIA